MVILVPEDTTSLICRASDAGMPRKAGNVRPLMHASSTCYIKDTAVWTTAPSYADVDSEKSVCILIAIINDHGKISPSGAIINAALSQQSVSGSAGYPRTAQSWNQSRLLRPGSKTTFPDVVWWQGMPTGADIPTMALGFRAK